MRSRAMRTADVSLNLDGLLELVLVLLQVITDWRRHRWFRPFRPKMERRKHVGGVAGHMGRLIICVHIDMYRLR
jgi:hypothetical protein